MLIVFYCTSFHGNSCPTTKYVLLHLTTPLQKCNVMTGSNCGPAPPVPQTTWDFNYFPKLWQHGAKSRFITISGIFPRALSLRRDCANFQSFLPPSRSRVTRVINNTREIDARIVDSEVAADYNYWQNGTSFGFIRIRWDALRRYRLKWTETHWTSGDNIQERVRSELY